MTLDSCAPTPPDDPAAIARTYERLGGQIEWLTLQPGLDEEAVAQAVTAALRGQPLDRRFASGGQQNVILRLATLWALRGPFLSGTFLVTGPARLDGVAAGTGTLAEAVRTLAAWETRGAPSLPADLQARLRALLGPEAAAIESLWSEEAWTLAPRLVAWRERLASPAGCALLDEVSAAVAQAAAAPVRGPLATVDELIARARRDVPAAIVDEARTRVAPARLAAARADAEEALARAPDHIEALQLRADLRLLQRTELPEAVADVERAIALAPERGALHVTRALLAQAQGQLDRAVAELTLALDAAQPAEPARLFRAVLRVETGDLDGAESDALAARPAGLDHPAVHYVLGQVRAGRGDTAGAMAAFAAALALDSRHAGTYLARARLHQRLGDLQSAIADADRAVAVADQGDAYYNRGVFRLAAGEYRGAEADFDTALEHEPNDVQARLNRATVRLLRGDLPAAAADAEVAATVAPEYAPARLKRALIGIQQGRRDGGVSEDLRAALACAPADWPARAEVERMLAELTAPSGMVG
jgi:tetratricopeptide (TPR) repeat protein